MPATPQDPALLQPSFHWVLQLQEDVDLQLAGLDLPITSNVLTFSGGFSDVINLRNVYRPASGREVR